MATNTLIKSTVNQGSNVIALANQLPINTVFSLGTIANLQMRWNGTDIQIATITGTASIELATVTNYGIESVIVNGGAGIDGTATNLSLTTTFVTAGDSGTVGLEKRQYHIWKSTGEYYIVEILKKGALANTGDVTYVAYQPGVTSSQILQAGSGINIINNVISSTLPSLKAHVRVNLATCTFIAGGGAPITWGTELQDTTNSFVNTTGIFTAPRTGYYNVNFQVFVGNTTSTVGTRGGVILSVNNAGFGSNNPIHSETVSTANQGQFSIKGSETKFLNANDTLTLKGFLDAWAVASLSSNPNFDFLTIDEL